MPGDLVPGQMYDHECNVVKGWWHAHAVDKTAAVASGETILAGSVCYLDSNGEFRLGLPDNTVGCFAWPNSNDFDVSADVGNIQSKNLMGLPTVAAYELWTTEYDSSFTYNIHDYLTAWDSQLPGYLAANKGKVAPGRPYHNTIVGIVSDGVKVNEFKKNVLTLWTYHLPIDLEVHSSDISVFGTGTTMDDGDDTN